MYKYSRQAQERYFDYPTFAFLFDWFAHHPEAVEFSDSKNKENPDPNYP